jgi:predicted dienelactone hydrolase
MKYFGFAMLSATAFAQSPAHDPLKVPESVATKPQDFTVHDAQRNRDLPIRVYLPGQTKPAPVVLFGHGLGGSRENNPYRGKHGSARGYVVVFVQHPGSDESVWKAVRSLQIPFRASVM